MEKEYRIKKTSDFDKIIKKKQSFANRQFVMYYQKNNLEHMRLGISVSKKLGKAHKRNKLKRYVRESFKTKKESLANYDIIVIVRPMAVDIDFQNFEKSINHILKKVKLYSEKRD